MKTLTKTQNTIGILILFCITLMLLRAVYTQSLFLGFLLWNIILATIPYVISQWIIHYKPIGIKLYILLITWLLFLPNAPYIITDFIHLQHSKASLLWYDIFMIFCFANTGLLLAIISMSDIYQIIKQYYGKVKTSYIITGITILCGFGIFLGRFLRFNSWDIVTNPVHLVIRSLTSLKHSKTWFITLGFASLLWILFYVFQNIKQAKN